MEGSFVHFFFLGAVLYIKQTNMVQARKHLASLSEFRDLLPKQAPFPFFSAAKVDVKTRAATTRGAEMIWMLVICFTAMAVMEFMPKLPFKIFKARATKTGGRDSLWWVWWGL